MVKYLYTYDGKKYSWKELIDFLVGLDELEEKKEKWWKRIPINKYSFGVGFSKGALFGVRMIANDTKNNYSITDDKNKKKKVHKK